MELELFNPCNGKQQRNDPKFVSMTNGKCYTGLDSEHTTTFSGTIEIMCNASRQNKKIFIECN